MDKLDANIRDAMKALESTVPDSYFDQFESRLEARLEVEAMAGPEMMEQGVGMDDSPPPVSPPEPKEENTGLHDIKELARSQKKRISKRMTTESDLEQSLLASSSALSAVALPEPGKDKPTFETRGTTSRSKSKSTSTDAATAVGPAARGEDPRGLPVWIYAAVGVVAAAAVIFFIVRGGKDDSTSSADQVAMSDNAAAEKKGDGASATARGADSSKSLAPSATGGGAATDGVVQPDDGDTADSDDTGDDPGMVAEADDGDDDDDDSAERSALTRDADKDRGADRDKKKSDKKKSDKKKDDKKKSDKKKSDNKKDDKKDAKKDDTSGDKKKDDTGGGEPSLDDLLNDASGGAVDTSGGSKETVKKPSKKKLSSSDIKKGMAPIMGSAKACYDGEPGTVKIKFSVDPSGKVTKAYAMGKWSDKAAGKCIARLVKGVTFPAFDGRTSSFSFPFLLTQ